MYLRPLTLKDTVVDFANFSQGFIYSTTGLNTTDHALQYYIVKNGLNALSNPLLISTDGTATTNYSIVKKDNLSVGYTFKRGVTGPGLYSDTINYFNKYVELPTTDPNYSLPRPYLTETHTYSYYMLQKAITIVKVGTSGQTIFQNQTAVVNVGDSMLIDCSLSRGYETSFSFNIYKRTHFGVWVLATKDSDFSLTLGTNNPSYIITPLVAAEFKLVVKTVGFNSNNNPFGANADLRDMISDNSDTLTFYMNSGVTARVDTITLPAIKSIVSAFVDNNSNPMGYANTQMLVSADIMYGTGSWNVDGLPITPTNEQWLELLLDNTDIQLHAFDSNGKDLIPPFVGLGPHKVTIPKATSCTFNYITKIK